MAWTWGGFGGLTGNCGGTKAGLQALRLEVVPSTYNYFGPHHYFAGDRHVVSPDQFAGKRNFADPAMRRQYLVRQWHFRPFRLRRHFG